MVAWLRIGVAVSVAAVVGACAHLPSDAKVKQFASAVDKAAAVYIQSISFNRDISEKTGEENAAGVYIARGGAADDAECIALAKRTAQILVGMSAQSASKACKYSLPPESTKQISDENRKLRLSLMNAIGGYAKALGEAADKGAIDNVEAAVMTLGAATSTAVTPLLAGAAIPVLSPATKIVARSVGLAVGNAYAVEIRQVMAQAEEPLKKAVILLKASVVEIRKNNERKFRDWRIQKKANLGIIAAKPDSDDLSRSTTSEAYVAFRVAVSEARDLQTKAVALDGYENVLDSMLKAHAELLEPDADASDALAKFTKVTDDFAALAPTLQKK